MPRNALDSFDKLILDLVQKDASVGSEALGGKVGLSASSVQRRLKRLKRMRVISAEIAVVQPEEVGKPCHFITSLEVESERADLVSRLRSWLRQEDRVQQVFYVTGTVDFVLVIVTESVDQYEELMSDLLASNPNVRRYTTNVVLSVQKRGLAVPIKI